MPADVADVLLDIDLEVNYVTMYGWPTENQHSFWHINNRPRVSGGGTESQIFVLQRTNGRKQPEEQWLVAIFERQHSAGDWLCSTFGVASALRGGEFEDEVEDIDPTSVEMVEGLQTEDGS